MAKVTKWIHFFGVSDFYAGLAHSISASLLALTYGVLSQKLRSTKQIQALFAQFRTEQILQY